MPRRSRSCPLPPPLPAVSSRSVSMPNLTASHCTVEVTSSRRPLIGRRHWSHRTTKRSRTCEQISLMVLAWCDVSRCARVPADSVGASSAMVRTVMAGSMAGSTGRVHVPKHLSSDTTLKTLIRGRPIQRSRVTEWRTVTQAITGGPTPRSCVAGLRRAREAQRDGPAGLV